MTRQSRAYGEKYKNFKNDKVNATKPRSTIAYFVHSQAAVEHHKNNMQHYRRNHDTVPLPWGRFGYLRQEVDFDYELLEIERNLSEQERAEESGPKLETEKVRNTPPVAHKDSEVSAADSNEPTTRAAINAETTGAGVRRAGQEAPFDKDPENDRGEPGSVQRGVNVSDNGLQGSRATNEVGCVH